MLLPAAMRALPLPHFHLSWDMGDAMG